MWFDLLVNDRPHRSRNQWPPTPQLVEMARLGNRDALEQLLTAGHPRLVAFFSGAGPNHADADDLAAQVCEAVVKNISKLRDVSAFEGWFWAIARTTLRGWIRRRRRDPRPPPVSAAPRQPDELFMESEEHSLIRVALDTLSMRDRQLLWLREVEHLSYKDIGGRLGSTAGTIRVACHRARARLETAYNQVAHRDQDVM